MQFRLEIQAVESVCNFRLSWGIGGEQIIATVPYPTNIMLAYEHWREQYNAFYESLPINEFPSTTASDHHPLRGKADISGTLEPTPINWRLSLKHAQETLRSEFQEWLGRGELVHIRKKLFQAFAPIPSNPSAENKPILVLLSCHSLELDRLPWEDWESDFGANQQIRFVRSPLDILQPTPAKIYRPRLRMLAILGNEKGQDFADEKKALKSLGPQIKVEFLNLQDNSSIDLKQQICTAIEDPIGWDMLFFAGHSSESAVAGGIFEIAPNQWMLITELLPSLQIAKEQGLHLAIFNSCSGLHIAQSLVSVGLAQIVIMREQIHGQVASKFLVKMTQKLRQGQDSHTAFISACDYLKCISQNYPSAFLVPSLFAHPNATSISLRGWRWRSWFKQTLPKRREAIVLGSCVALSLLPQVREPLLNQRMWVQAQYRHITQQTPQTTPPVLLVQIDQETINRLKIGFGDKNVEIMDREVIAKIVDRLNESEAKVIGIDYILDIPTEKDNVLATSLRNGFYKYGTWPILAHARSERESNLPAHSNIANPQVTLTGCANSDGIWYLKLPDWMSCNVEPAIPPLPFMLATLSKLKQSPNLSQNLSQISQNQPLQQKLLDLAPQIRQTRKLSQVQESYVTFISAFYKQYWLQPIIDYSIPPAQVFQPISAYKIVQNLQPLKIQPNQVVIIAAGGYSSGGRDVDSDDTYQLPEATKYWRTFSDKAEGKLPVLTGGEAVSYATYHFLKQQFLIPIPDLWMLLITGSVGRMIQISPYLKRQKWLWPGIGIGYTGLSLHLYVSASILLPYLLPATVWVWYGLPFLWRQKNV